MSGRDPIPLYDDLKYPGHGMPDRAQNTSVPLSPWWRLAKDQGLGHKATLLYDAVQTLDQPCAVDILEIQGDDLDAVPLQITLGQPLAIPRRPADFDGLNLQTQTGEFPPDQFGNADYPGTTDPITWPPFIAVITWGVGGARASVQVDFVAGQTVNLGPATFVRVTAAVPPDAINAPGTSGAYTLSAFIGPGSPRAAAPAQRTIYTGVIASDAESDIFVVPPFAKRATVISADESAGVPAVTVAYLRFWQSPDGTNCVGNYIVNGNQPLPFNVPNGAQYFSLVNGMGADVSFSALFELAV